MSQTPFRVLIPFHTSGSLYGAERSVMEIFDLLRPDIEPLFVVSGNLVRRGLPVTRELERRKFSFVTFTDNWDWPSPGRPASFRQFINMVRVFRAGNKDILRHARSCDALYLPGIGYGRLALRAMRLYRRERKRIVLHFHEFGSRDDRRVNFLNRFVTDYVHTTGYGQRMAFTLNPSIRSRRNHVIPYPVESPEYSRNPQIAAAFDGHRNIVYAGQVSRTKGIDILLEAFAKIAPRYPDARLHIVGDGEMKQTSSERVVYWGFQNDVDAFFRNACMVVQSTPPSRYNESFGRAVIEAALAGVPAVTFRSGALPDVVGKGGTVCSEETPAFMADAISFYLDNPEIRDLHAQYAVENAKSLTNPQKIRQAWLEVFGLS